MTWNGFREVLRPKVEGTLVLDEILAEVPLDFFAMFSSASSVWGSALASSYVAANAFLDAMAHQRTARGVPGLALNWGWWGDSTMAVGHSEYFESMGLTVLPDAVGFEALGRLLGSSTAQLVVAPVEWGRFRSIMEAKRRRPMFELLGTPTAAPRSKGDQAFLRSLRDAPGPARRRLMEGAIQRAIAVVMQREPGSTLDPVMGFFEAGMDSIMSVELKGRLDSLVGCDIPATAAFENPTVRALAAYLVEQELGLGTDADDVPADPAPRPTAIDLTGAGPEIDLTELDALDEDELIRLLGAELSEEEA